jgi:hypothetical protein
LGVENLGDAWEDAVAKMAVVSPEMDLAKLNSDIKNGVPALMKNLAVMHDLNSYGRAAFDDTIAYIKASHEKGADMWKVILGMHHAILVAATDMAGRPATAAWLEQCARSLSVAND